MRIGVVTTYQPRACGIAVFSGDLRRALLETESTHEVEIVSIVRGEAGEHPPEVVTTIRQDVPGDYPAAAAELTRRGADVVLVEHEYGIFGGEAGECVLALTAELQAPYVVTLHTVLTQPSPRQAATLAALCRRAALVMVFTETARQMVVHQDLARPDQVRVVPHGAPDILTAVAEAWTDPSIRPETPGLTRAAAELGLDRLADRTVLSTFGLISAGKGLELMIRALPAVVSAHPEVLYLIAGQTHPEVVNHEGERYRLGLERLVHDLGLTEHVSFVDRFLTIDELAVLLGRTDLYVTPYRSPEQIVSGALTFAVAAGCPVVSTPYHYAEDLLGSGAGVLVPFGDVPRLSAAVLDLLGAPETLEAVRAEARRVGADLPWASVGKVTLEVLAEAVHDIGPAGRRPPAPVRAGAPAIRADHLLRLVDDVGIVQHANGVVPARHTGYCVDDVARLAIVAQQLEQTLDDPGYQRVLASSLAFLAHAWDPTAPGMRNFMDYSRRWLDEPHLGDHFSRAVWALGEVLAFRPPRAEGRVAGRLLAEMAPALDRLNSPRELAYALLGLTRPELEALPRPLPETVATLATRLAGWYDENRRDGWEWFEEQLTYDNARLPQAMIAAGHRLGDPDLVQRGLVTLDWYAAQCGIDTDAVQLVGNLWRRAGTGVRGRAEGDEQPLDAAALVEALLEASQQTGGERFAGQAVRAFEWFLGRNRLGLPLYDPIGGGCHDGLGTAGPNDNQGAESTLAFLQAQLSLTAAGLEGLVGRGA